MMQKMLGRALIAGALVAAAVGVVIAPSASAQYPATAGAIRVTTSVFQTPVNTTITWICTLLDEDGNALPNEDCTITITQEPGDNAAVGSKVVTKITNSEGQTSGPLYVGTEPGEIILTATHEDLEAQTKVLVHEVFVGSFAPPGGYPGTLAGLFVPNPQNQQRNAVAPQQQAAPTVPAGIRPPSTGDAGLVEQQRSMALVVVAGVAVLTVTGLAGRELARKRA